MSEHFADIWVLLSDTDRFVSRAGLMKQYERLLRDWRSRLRNSSKDIDTIREIREEIVSFRKTRRSEGWELRLGSLDIQLKGFRSDDALGVGFQRMVLALGDNGGIGFITGSGNHIQLDEELSMRFKQSQTSVLFERHYLWYRRVAGVIELAGADSEDRDSFDVLKAYIDENKSKLVKALYKIS